MNKGLRVCAKVFNIIVTAVTIAVIVAILLYSFILPYVFHTVPFIVSSNSMEPAIQTGSVVFVDIKAREPDIGDIVTYRLGARAGEGVKESMKGSLVTHRIVSVDNNGEFVTKGDHNRVSDAKSVNQLQIVGTFRFTVPGVGYFLEKIQESVQLKIFLVALIALINIISVLFLALTDPSKTEKNGSDESENPPGTEGDGQETERKSPPPAEEQSASVGH